MRSSRLSLASPLILLMCGAVLGTGVTFLSQELFLRTPESDRRSATTTEETGRVSGQQPEIATAPAESWLERARKITMPDRREYVLPLNNPDVVPAAGADHMNADDLVVGITYHGHARAYPWWILSNFHVVNDTLVTNTAGKMPVYIGLCEQCSGAAAFVPVIDELPDRPLIFQVTGIRAGTIEISDLQTLSQWHPFSGEAVSGPLEGRQLEPIPFVMERWEVWKENHPDSEVVLGSSQMRRRPHGISHGAQIGHPFIPNFFAQVANLEDKRLPANELVYGMKVGEKGSALAVRLRDLKDDGFLELEHEGTPILLRLVGEFGVRAFVRAHEGEVMEFTKVPNDSSLLRDQSGSVWNPLGEAVGGRAGLDNAKLRLVRGYLTEWYEWVSNAPTTVLHNRIRTPGTSIPNITIGSGEGQAFPLAQLNGAHTVLVFACATSPLLFDNIAALEAVYRDYRQQGVNFYLVYRTLANPSLSGFVPPFTQGERVMQMQHTKAAFGSSIPWLCDNMGNELVDALNAESNSEVIISPGGEILQIRDWLDVGQLRDDLASLVGPVKPPSDPATISLQRGRLTTSAPKNVLPIVKIPYDLTPLAFTPAPSDNPFFVKLLAEADGSLLANGNGVLYLGFFLDPIYGVYWNNELPKLRYTIREPAGVTANPDAGTAPEVDQPRDIDPREFLVNISGWSEANEMTIEVEYTVCNDKVPFQKTVTQSYALTFKPKSFANPHTPRLAPQFTEGDIVANFLENDRDGDGRLTAEEIPPSLEGADSNQDGQIDAAEMKRVEAQILNQQNYQW